MISPNEALNIASKAARLSGALLMTQFGEQHDFHFKDKSNSVSIDMDVKSSRLIIHSICESWFDLTDTPILIITEERSCAMAVQNINGVIDYQDYNGDLQDWAGPCWVIDPICGSIAYARGIRDFIISIALVNNHQVLLAVVYDPCHDELFHAILGKGAYLNGIAIHPSRVSEMNEAVVSVEHKVFRDIDPIIIHRIAICVRRMRTAMTCGLELCYVACGRLDAVIKLDQAFYDYIGGALILAESTQNKKSFISLSDENVLPFSHLGSRASFIAANGLIGQALYQKLKSTF